MKAFEKILSFTDIHFGLRNDSRDHNEMCLEFIDWAVAVANERGCDAICFIGDWHDHRTKIGVETLNYSEKGLEKLSKSGLTVYFVLGNHDLFFRENRNVHSLPFAPHHNIHLISEPTHFGDTAFVPWVVHSDDKSLLVNSNTKYVFGHFEFSGFLMNGGYAAPDRKGHLRAEDLEGPDYIFSGHFHLRQVKTIGKTEIHYIGNCFPHDFSDASDTARGVMILERGGKPEYVNWPSMPTFFKIKASELEDSVSLLNSRSVVKIIPDIVMDDATRMGIEEFLHEEIGVMRVSTDPSRTVAIDGAWQPGDVQDIDSLVLDWIENGGDVPDTYSKPKLVEIYLGVKN